VEPGRHARLRGVWGNPCGFKSRLRHQLDVYEYQLLFLMLEFLIILVSIKYKADFYGFVLFVYCIDKSARVSFFPSSSFINAELGCSITKPFSLVDFTAYLSEI
jgi:hypothetical protein